MHGEVRELLVSMATELASAKESGDAIAEAAAKSDLAKAEAAQRKAKVAEQYQVGRPIQWGAFSSTSTDFDVTKTFTSRSTGVIFKITVTDGRDIGPFSFFPQESEVLLSPSHRFFVSSEPYERDGYTIIDMVQQAGSAFIS